MINNCGLKTAGVYMAKVVEEVIVIKVSKLVREDAESAVFISDEFIAGLEAIASDMLDDASAIVEVVKG
jgi:hypothetical protein